MYFATGARFRVGFLFVADVNLAGGLLRAARTPAERDETIRLLAHEVAASVPLAESGVQVCADTLGGIEAFAYECSQAQIPIHGAEVGPVHRALVLRTAAVKDPDRKSTRLNSSHRLTSRMPSSA